MDSTIVLAMENVVKKIENAPGYSKIIMDNLSLSVKKGDFITVLGGNGAGKSTLFNLISGSMLANSGIIKILGKNVTQLAEEKRAIYVARVFQDPKMGTAPRMTVSENLSLALFRGEKRTLKRRNLKKYQGHFIEIIKSLGNGLEEKIDTPTENLSGGQRQALSLLMATLKDPVVLLLDEHTAALDPKTSVQLMEITNQRIIQNNLTCLMVTHRLEDALQYGNRLIVLEGGKIVKDFNAEEKGKLQLTNLLQFFG